MKQNECNPKETAIYEAVEKLLCAGADIHSIKISDVAETAGIGKGTVYEYFSSKEELLLKAITFYLIKAIDAAEALADEKQTFHDKFCAIMQSIYKNINVGYTSFRAVSQMSHDTLQDKIIDEGVFKTLFARIKEIINKFVAEGISQGVIPSDNDEEYTLLAVRSAIGGYIVSIKNPNDEETRNRVIENSYKLFVKALN